MENFQQTLEAAQAAAQRGESVAIARRCGVCGDWLVGLNIERMDSPPHIQEGYHNNGRSYYNDYAEEFPD